MIFQEKGTLWGMHCQIARQVEARPGRCTAGVVYDATVDLRADSKTFKQWLAVEFSSDIRRMRPIPGWRAHQFQAITAGVEVFCQMSEFHAPECARGVRWNDPAFGLRRPLEAAMIPGRARRYPDFMA